MADEPGGNNGGLYFIVGGLVVVVAVLGFLVTGGHFGHGHGPAKMDVTIERPNR